MTRQQKIEKILEINKNAKKEDLEMFSGEHLQEVFEYWIDYKQEKKEE